MHREDGFTLIEILIVVAIIAILASVVLVGLGPTQQAGRDARRISDIDEVQNALELYYTMCGYFPGTSTAVPCDAYANIRNPSGRTKDTWANLTHVLTTAPIGVSEIPSDPNTSHSYVYSVIPGGAHYLLDAALDNKNDTVFINYSPPVPGATELNYRDGDGPPGLCLPPQYCVVF